LDEPLNELAMRRHSRREVFFSSFPHQARRVDEKDILSGVEGYKNSQPIRRPVKAVRKW
jgi:hypothetical protein